MELNKISAQETVNSAVMVLHDLSTDSFILTKRSENMRYHPGDICFPGGVWEMQDENLYATALRELFEELGIEANRITQIKELRTERTLLGSIIHPWLASIESIHPYQLNQDEVSALIPIPRALVINSKNYRNIIIDKAGKHFKTCEFISSEEFIWGATARIMKQLVFV